MGENSIENPNKVSVDGPAVRLAKEIIERGKFFEGGREENSDQLPEAREIINAVILTKDPALRIKIFENLSKQEIFSIAEFISQQDDKLIESYLETFKSSQEITKAIEESSRKKEEFIAAQEFLISSTEVLNGEGK